MSDDQNNAVINLLTNITRDTSQIKTDLAVNTTKTTAIEEHLKILNSKVAKQEERVQEVERAKETTAEFISNFNDLKKRRDDFWKELVGKLLWAIIPAISIAAWKIVTYLINQGVFS